MNYIYILLIAMTLLSAENKSINMQSNINHEYSWFIQEDVWFNKIPAIINIKELISNEIRNSDRADACNDLEACNYIPESNSPIDCMYPEDYGWCDCDGNIPDCSGECGGSNNNGCTIMNFDVMGIYENDDCTGELISEVHGTCVLFVEYSSGWVYNEQTCVESGGLWLPADYCYEVDFDTQIGEDECIANGGVFSYDSYYGTFCLTINSLIEISSVNECLCGEGGVFDENEGCVEGGDEMSNHWVSSYYIFPEASGEPALYFFDDFTWSEVCDGSCSFDEIPSEVDCEYAGGQYGNWSYCDFEEVPSENDCESAGGDYADYGWCQFDEQISETDCDSAGGEFYINEGCDFDQQPTPEDCEIAGGDFIIWSHCDFDEQPSQEECEAAEGNYDDDDEVCNVWEEDICNALNGEYWEDGFYCYVSDEGVCNTLGGEYFQTAECFIENGLDEGVCNTLGGEWDGDSSCFVWDEGVCNTLGGEWEEDIYCDVENEDICYSLSGSPYNGMWYTGLCPEGTYTIEGDVFTLLMEDGGGPNEGLITGTISFDINGDWNRIEFKVPGMGYEDIDFCMGMVYTSDPNMGMNELINPDKFSISNIYPNPFNPVTNITYSLPENGNVQLTVYNIQGRQVHTLIDNFQSAGYHSINWNASSYTSGVYLIRMVSGQFTQVQKVVLVK